MICSNKCQAGQRFSYFNGILCLATAVVLFVGCGRKDDRVSVYPVTGVVKVAGAPAAGAKVVLYAEGGQGAHVPFPTGVVQSDGTFRLTSYAEGDGAPAGNYKVTVEWLEPIPAGADQETYSPADRLRGRYAKPDRSQLTATITEGTNSLQPFELK